MTKKVFLITLLIGAWLCLGPSLALGQLLVEPSGTSTCQPGYSGTNCGDYTVNDFIILAINASRIILGLVGSLSLIMFIYGGFTFLISAGSSGTIDKAKKILIASTVGLLIVFTSFLVIKFILQSMGISWNGEMLKLP